MLDRRDVDIVEIKVIDNKMEYICALWIYVGIVHQIRLDRSRFNDGNICVCFDWRAIFTSLELFKLLV